MFASLDPAYIAAVQTSLVRQRLLRHVEPVPPCANTLAKNVEIWVHPAMSPGW